MGWEMERPPHPAQGQGSSGRFPKGRLPVPSFGVWVEIFREEVEGKKPFLAEDATCRTARGEIGLEYSGT